MESYRQDKKFEISDNNTNDGKNPIDENHSEVQITFVGQVSPLRPGKNTSFNLESSKGLSPPSPRIKRSQTLDSSAPITSPFILNSTENFLELDKHLDITSNINVQNTGSILACIKYNKEVYANAVEIKNGKCTFIFKNKKTVMTSYYNYAIVEMSPGTIRAVIDSNAHFYLTLDWTSFAKVAGRYALTHLFAKLQSADQTKLLTDLESSDKFKQLDTEDAIQRQQLPKSLQVLPPADRKAYVIQALKSLANDPNAKLSAKMQAFILQCLPNPLKYFKFEKSDLEKLDYHAMRTLKVFAAGGVFCDNEGHVLEIEPRSGYAHSCPKDEVEKLKAADSEKRARNSFAFFQYHNDRFVTYRQSAHITMTLDAQVKANNLKDEEVFKLRRELVLKVRYAERATIFRPVSPTTDDEVRLTYQADHGRRKSENESPDKDEKPEKPVNRRLSLGNDSSNTKL